MGDKMDMVSRYLVDEIIEDIIVRLPVKSITRFKCVCKSWFNLITSKRFIHKHLANGDECFLALFYNDRGVTYDQWFFDVSRYDDPKDISVTMRREGRETCVSAALHHFELPFTFDTLDSLKLVGVCNGIVCFRDQDIVFLVNPLLVEMKTVVIPVVEEEKCKLVGFGIENKALNLKFVRIMSFYDDERRKHQAAEVYNIPRNSLKRLGEGEVPLVVKYSSQYSMFFNGILHWCVAEKGSDGRILAFNLETELFQLMELPPCSLSVNQLRCSSLFVLNQESLAFASYPESFGFPNNVNVWKMSEYGIGETWTKLYTVGPLDHFRKPWCFWKKSTFIYEESSGKLISYDLLNQSKTVLCRMVPHHWSFEACRPIFMHCLERVVCRATLISINDI